MDFSEKYCKKRKLGEGSQAEVWLVEQRNTGADAAMKLYSGESAEAKREIQILKDMGGKGIPFLIDLVETEGKKGIVMEYVEGKSLRMLLEEQRIWTEAEAVETAVKIAEILNEFHKKAPAVVYADLKPENIMMTPEGKIYLVDFGAAVYEGEKQKKLFGTRGYLPPCGEEKVTPYRDTYGLGAILYEMLTGYPVSEGIENGKADISHLSEKCRQMMQKAVRIRSREGYANAGQMLEDLRGCQNQQEERQAGRRRKRMRQKRKNGKRDYFICDLRRVSLRGHAKITGLICVCLIAAGLLGGGETKAAKITKEGTVFSSENETLTREYRTECQVEADAAPKPVKQEKSTDSKEEPLRDEYGRKLVIRPKVQ